MKSFNISNRARSWQLNRFHENSRACSVRRKLVFSLGNVFAQWPNVLRSVGAVSATAGWMIGKDRYDPWAILPAAVALVWGILWVIRKTIAAHWTWIQWKSFGVSMLTVLVAAFLRRWDSSNGYRKGGLGLFAEKFFGSGGLHTPDTVGSLLDIAVLTWLLAQLERQRLTGENPSHGHRISHNLHPSLEGRVWNRDEYADSCHVIQRRNRSASVVEQIWFAGDCCTGNALLSDHLNARLVIRFCGIVVRRARSWRQSVRLRCANPQAAQRARTPWVLLEWIIVGNAWVRDHGEPGICDDSDHALCLCGRDWTAFLLRDSHPVAENVKYVTIDGKRATLEPGGPGEWRTTTTQGIREIYVAYDSDSVLSQERFFHHRQRLGRDE